MSAAVAPLDVSIRMSSGSSRRKLKPRSGASSCIDDTPRSASTPSTRLDAARVEHLDETAVVAVHQLDTRSPNAVSASPRSRQRVGIAIDPDQPRRAGLEQRPCVSAETHRAIDEHAAARRREMLEHLGHHHRFVHHSHQCPMLKAQCSRPNDRSPLSIGHCAFGIGHCSEVMHRSMLGQLSRRRPSTARAAASARSARRSTLRDSRCARRRERRLQSRRCLGGARE